MTAYSSAKAANVTEMLLLNMHNMVVPPSNPNPNQPYLTPTVT